MYTDIVLSLKEYKLKSILCFLFLVSLSKACAQKTTEDLSFLLGKWNIERIYNPKTENPSMIKRTLDCEYNMELHGRANAMDIIYFNHNNIYNEYERPLVEFYLAY
ncbi:hypothetical protein, partial [Allomuricauda sp. CP2A]|jgi:hypothetical protein|uniref:hypothetical protein n=1 Tax=Allomuricauda sp. CP2A TaxID=1848189 RepID=UPI001C400B06